MGTHKRKSTCQLFSSNRYHVYLKYMLTHIHKSTRTHTTCDQIHSYLVNVFGLEWLHKLQHNGISFNSYNKYFAKVYQQYTHTLTHMHMHTQRHTHSCWQWTFEFGIYRSPASNRSVERKCCGGVANSRKCQNVKFHFLTNCGLFSHKEGNSKAI